MGEIVAVSDQVGKKEVDCSNEVPEVAASLEEVFQHVGPHFRFEERDFSSLACTSTSVSKALRSTSVILDVQPSTHPRRRWHCVGPFPVPACIDKVKARVVDLKSLVASEFSYGRDTALIERHSSSLERLTVFMGWFNSVRWFNTVVRSMKCLHEWDFPRNNRALDLARALDLTTLQCSGLSVHHDDFMAIEPRPDYILYLDLPQVVDGRLPALSTLDLTKVELTSSDLSSLTNLKILNLTSMKVSDLILPASLREFRLHSCCIKKEFDLPAHLAVLVLLAVTLTQWKRSLYIPSTVEDLTIDPSFHILNFFRYDVIQPRKLVLCKPRKFNIDFRRIPVWPLNYVPEDLMWEESIRVWHVHGDLLFEHEKIRIPYHVTEFKMVQNSTVKKIIVHSNVTELTLSGLIDLRTIVFRKKDMKESVYAGNRRVTLSSLWMKNIELPNRWHEVRIERCDRLQSLVLPATMRSLTIKEMPELVDLSCVDSHYPSQLHTADMKGVNKEFSSLDLHSLKKVLAVGKSKNDDKCEEEFSTNPFSLGFDSCGGAHGYE